MRKVVAYMLAVILALSGVSLFGQITTDTVHAQEKAPELKRVRPGTITAGAPTFTIRLEGKNFAEGARVRLDGVLLESSRVTSKGKVLLAEVSAAVVATPGTHSVEAVNPDGTATPPETLTVVAKDPELEIRLEGNAAQEGTGQALIIDITGGDFNENSKVLVWGTTANSLFVNKGTLRVEIPAKYTDAPARIPIMVRNKGDRFSNVEIFFIVPRPANLESVDPDTVEVGAEDFEITVQGSNFKDDAVLIINGIRIEPTERKDGRLKALVPGSFRSQPGQLVVRVEQDGIQSDDFTIAVTPSDDPFIFVVAPILLRQGEDKESIDIVGANFGDDSVVLIDGQEAKVKGSTRRRLTVIIPEDLLATVGTHTIQVKSKDGTVSNIATFAVVPDSTVSTFVGDGKEGFNADATCVSGDEARFRRPRRLAFGPDGLLYVTDQFNHVIRTVNISTREVCTLSGTGEPGYNDTGNPRDFPVTFSYPNGVAVASDGTIYVTENGNNVVRRIRKTGASLIVDTFAGEINEITDKSKQEALNSTRVGLDGFRDGDALGSRFRSPDDILVAPDGSIYVADANNHAVRRIRFSGGQVVVETVAGNGVPGFADGVAENARFNTPLALALSANGNFLYVADTNNNRVRRIDLANRIVSTFTGNGAAGDSDGPPAEARFQGPIGLAFDTDGTLYVSEFQGNRIRRVDPSGNVSTLAGTGSTKLKDGPGISATFNRPRGLAFDAQRRVLYVADYENSVIRAIALP